MKYEKIHKSIVIDSLKRKSNYFDMLIDTTRKSIQETENEIGKLSNNSIENEIEFKALFNQMFYLKGLLNGYNEAKDEINVLIRIIKECEVF